MGRPNHRRSAVKTHTLVQGSAEWHKHRGEHDNASDAPAMLGVSPHKTRAALLQEYATGFSAEIDAGTQRLFDEGHRAEARARPLAEAIIGEDLYPVVGSEGRLSASFDGITMGEDIAFEHKSLNGNLRDVLHADCKGFELPMQYQAQLEQQCMVAGCKRVLFMASKWDDDQLIEERHCWYVSNPELAARIVAGWAQFHADVAAYKPEPAKVDPVGAVIDALPALSVVVEGRVIDSNLAPFREAASTFLASINTDLKTDQDFADAERVIKFCADGEARLELVKQQALSQTSSIDELFRTIDSIKTQMREKRLSLNTAVSTRKSSIRTEIITEHQALLEEHRKALNDRLGARWLPSVPVSFSDAMKGKKSVTSCREAAGVALANAKMDLTALAECLSANRTALHVGEKDWFFLFADFATVGVKPVDDFAAIAAMRIQKHEAEAQAEIDRKAAAESAATAKSAADLQVQVVAETVVAAPAPAPAVVRAAPLRPVVDNRPPITTGALCDWLGFDVNVDFLKGLGIMPAMPPAPKKSGTYWNVRDLPAIKVALVRHIDALPDLPAAVQRSIEEAAA